VENPVDKSAFLLLTRGFDFPEFNFPLSTWQERDSTIPRWLGEKMGFASRGLEKEHVPLPCG